MVNTVIIPSLAARSQGLDAYRQAEELPVAYIRPEKDA